MRHTRTPRSVCRLVTPNEANHSVTTESTWMEGSESPTNSYSSSGCSSAMAYQNTAALQSPGIPNWSGTIGTIGTATFSFKHASVMRTYESDPASAGTMCSVLSPIIGAMSNSAEANWLLRAQLIVSVSARKGLPSILQPSLPL